MADTSSGPPERSTEWIADVIMEAIRTVRIGVFVLELAEDRLNPGRTLYVSEPAAEAMGYTVEELKTSSPFLALAPGEEERLRARAAARLRGKLDSNTFELRTVRKDGQIVPMEVTICYVEREGREVLVSFSIDISARKKAEERILRSEALFRALIERAPDPIAIYRKNQLLYANPAFVGVLGYTSAEEVLALPIDQIIHPDDLPLVYLHGGQSGPQAARPLAPAYRAKRRDGTYVVLEVSSIAIEYEGEPAILGFARDVTERRRLEAQLVQADRLAALGTMAAGVAHEVNNPLAYLLLNLEWLERKLPKAQLDPARYDELATIIREARQGAERVGAIVRDLRAFSRADGETRRPVDLRRVASAAIKMAAHEIRHRGRIVTDYRPTRPVWGNEARLEQVLLNLLFNAAQALPETSVDRNEIRVCVREGGPESAIVEVTDNGAGIPPEAVRRIFDPFFTTKPVGIGTGLGLSICHTIVTSLGGDITVDSRVGEGSTFRIVLPICHDAYREGGHSPGVPAAPIRRPRRARILVIDDEVAIARTLCDLLQCDHDIDAVTSASQALERVRGGADYDVIFCDLMMPDITGMDLYDVLHAQEPGLEDRLVFMTAGAFTPRASEFLARVPNRRIEKPFSLGQIEKIVTEMAYARGEAAPLRLSTPA